MDLRVAACCQHWLMCSSVSEATRFPSIPHIYFVNGVIITQQHSYTYLWTTLVLTRRSKILFPKLRKLIYALGFSFDMLLHVQACNQHWAPALLQSVRTVTKLWPSGFTTYRYHSGLQSRTQSKQPIGAIKNFDPITGLIMPMGLKIWHLRVVL